MAFKEEINFQACRQAHHNESLLLQAKGTFCSATWDLLLCWPPTLAGEKTYLPCPPMNGIDPNKKAERTCSIDGSWESEPNSILVDPSKNPLLQGWTDYSNCFLPGIRDLIERLDSGSSQDADDKLFVARTTRILELTGFSISLLSLIASLFIFAYFRSLHNQRTNIHKNLFIAIGIQVIVRLSLYIDQVINPDRSRAPLMLNNATAELSIHTTAHVCESFYVALEYARTAMFVWMFIEGLYLHNYITVMIFQPDTYHRQYMVLGWGVPVILTTIWASVVLKYQPTSLCLGGYSFTATYWILEGPRLTVILVNLILLLNIIRVLVTKLRDSQCSEAEKLRKAVKAAIVLLPLLGITNALVMIDAPLHRSPLEFAIWSYSSHFLTSFQGFFVALIYCFLNGEVRSTLAKRMRNYLMDRRMGASLLGSRGISVFNSVNTETERHDDHPSEKHPRRNMRVVRPDPDPERPSSACGVSVTQL